MNTISLKENPDEFRRLCQEQGFEYISTVHHFEKDELGFYNPVFWSDVAATDYDRRK